MILNNYYICILRLEELFLIYVLFYISLNLVFKLFKFSSDVFKLFFNYNCILNFCLYCVISYLC